MRVDSVDTTPSGATDDTLPVVPVFVRHGDETENLVLKLRALAKRAAALQIALDNCRVFAARNRKEDWAKTVLRFCTEGGSTASPLRYEEDDSV